MKVASHLAKKIRRCVQIYAEVCRQGSEVSHVVGDDGIRVACDGQSVNMQVARVGQMQVRRRVQDDSHGMKQNHIDEGVNHRLVEAGCRQVLLAAQNVFVFKGKGNGHEPFEAFKKSKLN
jgi:hypothetical protein